MAASVPVLAGRHPRWLAIRRLLAAEIDADERYQPDQCGQYKDDDRDTRQTRVRGPIHAAANAQERLSHRTLCLIHVRRQIERAGGGQRESAAKDDGCFSFTGGYRILMIRIACQ